MEIFLACLMIFGLWLILKPKQPKQANNKRTAYQAKYARLLNMLGGDRDAANRLIAAYGIDKALEDLIRDRR